MSDTPQDRRGLLIREAARLFHEHGYDRTTVRELGEAVGLQSGSLFHHFKTKEDILQAVMLEVSTINAARMAAAVANGRTTRERLRGLVRAELEALHGETRAAMSVLFFQWRSLSAEKQTPVLRLRDEYEGYWLSVLEQARKEGLIVLEPALQRRLLMGSTGWTIYWFQSEGSLTLDALADQILASVLRETSEPTKAD